MIMVEVFTIQYIHMQTLLVVYRAGLMVSKFILYIVALIIVSIGHSILDNCIGNTNIITLCL